jgi:hypothetical protein
VRDDGIHANESLALGLVPSADPPRWWRAHARRQCALFFTQEFTVTHNPGEKIAETSSS